MIEEKKVNEKFEAYVTRTAFSLNLSGLQIGALMCIKHDYTRLRHIGLNTINALINKGLVEHESYGMRINASHNNFMSFRYVLTDVGEKVLELCQMAGLINFVPEKANV